MQEQTSGIERLPAGLDDAEIVARGGFASVYRAWQVDFHRDVAVKLLNADVRDPEVRARFEREVRAMGAVSDHPNVVPVYDAGIVDDRAYLVMPYLSGGSLAKQLGRGPMDPDEVVRVGRAVADALDAAHRNGLLHRDVKPANILRTSHGEPKLADFGVARFADATATNGQLALTVAYAAPEVLRGQPASVASDVYSLGATLHALLLGAPPFEVPDDGAPLAMAMRIVTEDAPDLRAAGVPADLAAVVERAMAKDPAARYPSAAALRNALDQLDDDPAVLPPTVVAAPIDLRDTTPAPAPAPVPPPVTRPPATGRRRTWWPLALVALIALGVIAVALGAASGGGDDPRASEPPATTAAPAPETTASPETAPETTPTTAASTTTSTDEPATTVATGASGDPVDAARDYFAVLDAGDIGAGWARLSERYQEESGEDAYRGFWSTIESVEVLEAEPGPDDLTATVTLRYVRDDGSTTTETNTLRFVEGPDGTLLIDGSS